MAGFFILAYTLSWLAWLSAILLGGGQALLVPGAFGPAVAAFIVLRATGGSVGAWARQILHWRAQPRWYLYALGLPALLFAIVNGSLVLLGKPIDLSLLAERAPSYLAAFAFVTLLGGGHEEPGWRGFALPRPQRRFTPLRATLLLAALWGLWHLPIYGLGLVGPMLFAVFYTYLYNRSGRRPGAGRRAASGKEQQMTTTPQTRRPQPSPGGPDRAGRPTAAAAAASPLAGQCPPGDLRPQLGPITVPTLVCVGRYDPQTPGPANAEIAAALPAGCLEVFGRSGHYPFVEEPDRFAAVVAAFLSSVAR